MFAFLPLFPAPIMSRSTLIWLANMALTRPTPSMMPLAEGSSEVLNMTKVIHGIVRGRIIELTEDPGLAEDQEVELTVRIVPPTAARKPGDGLLRTEGALADDPYWDAIMEEVYQERKNDTRREM